MKRLMSSINAFALILAIIPAAAGTAGAQTARTKPYKVSPTLAEVVNLRHFKKSYPISTPRRAMLAKNLFVVYPGKEKQLFHVYEDNEYKNIPSFVTADSVLQLYHIFFDFTLRSVEEGSLYPAVERLTDKMLADSVRTWNEIDDPALKPAALKNIAYFAVVARTLGTDPKIPVEAEPIVAIELDLIGRHEGFAVGAIFPYEVDYSQFAPRGHYTRSERLQRYFRAMMWYGLTPFALRSNRGRADETIIQSLLLTRSMYRAQALGDWETVYEPTAFYVGAADDVTPAEWKALMDQVFGPGAAPSAFGGAMALDAFVAGAEKLRPAKIQNRRLIEPGKTVAPDPSVQLRFMGQRYIPDSEVMQRLTVPIKRVFPSGLDVMAAFGSERAVYLLDTYPAIYNPQNWLDYQAERAKVVEEFSRVKPGTWSSNLYWGWLNALRALLDPAPAGYPSFMRNGAWTDKSLATALASWAELRHDTILYGKQSGAEMGDGSEPAPYKGYVEPNVVFWERLLELTRESRSGLASRKLLTEPLEMKFESFETTLENLRTISEKQLRNEKLTREEYESIRFIGGTLEYLTFSVMTGSPDTWELVNETDKDMAMVADVHTGGTEVLEEAVGRANEILVIVPVEGRLVLTRGAVFSYYEFRHPAADRLTDGKWQEILNSGRAPEPPVWTKSFLAR